ncbi:DUF1120 domain-containing protein [Cupriavidus agavae]|uniref:Uncharacterized protein DUF1120 n=1 Tax=Cupriavidus agavae TaxID=1001822 RepID=A0A4Q7S759_9BURK|nr:DUF1120 domain-containing protein [Cupriavidus agavae]RZT41558.1 uncharacterized protein DUF1120 [Cupriavidus agavae]
MKKNLICATVLLALAPLCASAAETSDLTIGGKIRPAACNISLSNNGLVDFGTVPVKSLNASSVTELAEKIFDLAVACDDATRLVIHASDNYSKKAQTDVKAFLGVADAGVSGVVSDNGTAVGGMVLYPLGATGDGETALTLDTRDEGKTWKELEPTVAIVTWPTSDDYMGWGAVGATKPTAFSTMTQSYKIRMALAPRSKLPAFTSELPFVGSVTFRLIYI